MNTVTVKTVLYLGPQGIFYPFCPRVVSGLCEIRCQRSAHSAVGHSGVGGGS